MSYIGQTPTTAAFPFDQFSGNGTTTAFTMSYAPASTTSMVVCISGVVQNPNTYGISGLTLTFSAAPPTGTNNIGVLYLGIPATSVTTPGNTAYLSSTEFTATAGQTTFTPNGSYQVGFINVIRNGAQLAPSDYTATNGTTVVLGTACTLGDSVVIQVYNLVSVANALPSTGGTVTGATTFNSTVAVGGAATFSSTATINGGSASGYTGFKNRIINGEMDIDQRYAGTATANTINGYTLDRWYAYQSTSGKYTVQQNAGAVTPPTGYTNYLGVTSSSAYSILTTDQFLLFQIIEGLNTADLAWGTASAATVTLSFWVRSSLTGLFGGVIQNSGATRNYPFSFTINSANTWEQKTITIAGDTTGTWLTTNAWGIRVAFNLGTGATYSSTANAWTGTSFISAPTGATSVVGTSGATFYVTGVQFERGSNATSFEFRDYGRELMMCQRYYWVAARGNNIYLCLCSYFSSSQIQGMLSPKVSMRTAPSIEQTTGTNYYTVASGDGFNSLLGYYASTEQTGWYNTTEVSGTAGTSYSVYTNNASSFVALTAEL